MADISFGDYVQLRITHLKSFSAIVKQDSWIKTIKTAGIH